MSSQHTQFFPVASRGVLCWWLLACHNDQSPPTKNSSTPAYAPSCSSGHCSAYGHYCTCCLESWRARRRDLHLRPEKPGPEHLCLDWKRRHQHLRKVRATWGPGRPILFLVGASRGCRFWIAGVYSHLLYGLHNFQNGSLLDSLFVPEIQCVSRRARIKLFLSTGTGW